jgi:hypothetical protein
MRSARRWLAAGLVSTGMAVLSLPSVAAANGLLDVYQDLAEARLSPAPLVPTAVPRALSPLDRTLSGGPSRRGNGYSLRIVHYAPGGPDAIIALQRGEFKTLAAALRDYTKRLGFHSRSTRVRGKRGYLLTRRLGPTQWWLVWVERGQVYAIGTGTPKKISLKQLRATAEGLEPVEHSYLGSSIDEQYNELGGILVTTQRTVSGHLDWSAQCHTADGFDRAAHAGSADVVLLARRGGSTFSFDVAKLGKPAGWSGTVAGTISESAITLNLHATGTFGDASCDTGPVSLVLDRRSR